MSRRSQFPMQRGFSLAEILVAVGIFALIFVAALAVYDASNKQFKQGIEAADTQQNVRVAFDKMIGDLRMAGYDFDRDGIPTGSAGTPWQPSRNYGIANLVTPQVPNGYLYQMVSVTTGGTTCTSNSAPPAWSTTIGNQFNDNNCRWKTLQGINQAQQPDEQIEFAGPTALTIRANYDYELNQTTDVEHGREPGLESPQFPVITTNNDEIVTYALRSINGANPDTIVFYADIDGRESYPGGRPENQVRIQNVNLGVTSGTGCTATAPCFNSPPYTLYRFTLDAAGGTIPTPLATNIRSLRFEYYNNVTGVPPAAIPANWTSTTQLTGPGDGQFDPDNATQGMAQRAARSIIRSVRLTLIGMGEVPDRRYTNPLEAAGSPAQNYRTYRLESLIQPRNLGKQGMREIPPNPPGAPLISDIVYGFCGAVQLSWLAPANEPGLGQVESYNIMYNTVNNGVFPYIQDAGPNMSGTVTNLDPNVTYYFTVAAINSYGYQFAVVPGSSTTQVISAQPRNSTTPGLPSAGAATGGTAGAALENQIRLTWTPPADNEVQVNGTRRTPAGATTSVELHPMYGEITTYKVYRSTDPNFTPVSADEVSTASPNSLQVGISQVTFIDKTAQNCLLYYYRVKGFEGLCDGCVACNTGGASAVTTGSGGTLYPPLGSPGITGLASATANPAAPASLTLDPAVTSECLGQWCNVYLQWPKVTTDVSTPPKPLVITKYTLTRTRTLPGNVPDGVDVLEATDANPFTGNYVQFADLHFPTRSPGNIDYTYEYVVQAKQCPDTAIPPAYSYTSAASPSLIYPCSFGASDPTVGVTLTMDGDGTTAATAWLTNNPASAVLVTGAGLQSVQALLDDGSRVIDLGTSTAGPAYNFPLSQTEVGAVYTLYIIAKDAGGCTRTYTRYIEESTPTGCCLAAFANDATVVSYIPGTDFVEITFKNLCNQPLDIQSSGVELKWDPAIANNGASPALATTLTFIDFPSTGTGAATLTVNDTAAAGTTAVRTVVRTPPTGGTPPAQNRIPAESSSYVIKVRFNRVLANATSPIVSACVVYQRPSLDTANQSCRIIPQPSTFNSCN